MLQGFLISHVCTVLQTAKVFAYSYPYMPGDSEQGHQDVAVIASWSCGCLADSSFAVEARP